MYKKFMLIKLFVLSFSVMYAQDNATARGGTVFTTFNDFNPKKDFYCGYAKPFKKLSKAGLIKGALHFKNITSGSVLLGKGQDRQSILSWAILEGVSDETLQEIADEFGLMFQEKFALIADLETVSPEKFLNAKNYAKVRESADETEDTGKLVGQVKVKTAGDATYNRIKPLKTPGLYSKVAKEAGGDAYSYDIVIDFARFDIQASRWKTKGYGVGYDFINTSTSSDVMPQISIKTTNSADRTKIVSTNFFMVNEKKIGGSITLGKNLFYNENYATSVDSFKGEMPAAIKKGIQINTKTTGTFVIKADEKKYKEVVLKALDEYSDLLIGYIESELR